MNDIEAYILTYESVAKAHEINYTKGVISSYTGSEGVSEFHLTEEYFDKYYATQAGADIEVLDIGRWDKHSVQTEGGSTVFCLKEPEEAS